MTDTQNMNWFIPGGGVIKTLAQIIIQIAVYDNCLLLWIVGGVGVGGGQLQVRYPKLYFVLYLANLLHLMLTVKYFGTFFPKCCYILVVLGFLFPFILLV